MPGTKVICQGIVRDSLSGCSPEIVNTAEGESIGLEVIRPERMMPELVFVFSPERHSLPNAHVGPPGRCKDRGGDVGLGQAWGRIVEAPNSNQIFDVWTNPVAFTPLIDRTT